MQNVYTILTLYISLGLTPLHVAVTMKDLNAVKLLLTHRADINLRDSKSGRTSLYLATDNDDPEIVEYLLKQGASITTPNYAGTTPLQCASGNSGIMKLLVKSGGESSPLIKVDTPPLTVSGAESLKKKLFLFLMIATSPLAY